MNMIQTTQMTIDVAKVELLQVLGSETPVSWMHNPVFTVKSEFSLELSDR